MKSRGARIVLILCILAGISAAALIFHVLSGNRDHIIPSLRFVFDEEQDIVWLRGRIWDLKGSDGVPKYTDVEVQTVFDPDTRRGLGPLSRIFQVRLYSGDLDRFSNDIRNALESEVPPKHIQISRER